MKSPTGFGDGEAEQHQRGGQDAEEHVHAAAHAPVGEPSAGEVADRHAEAEDDEHDGHHRRGQAGHLGGERGDVAVHGEEPAEADRPDAEREPHLRAAERPQLALHGRVLVARLPRHGEQHGHEREREDAGDGQVGDAPAGGLSEPGDRGHADHVRDRETRQHEGHAAGALARAHEARGDERRDAEVGAVRHGGDEPGHEHEAEGRQQRRGDRGERERDEEREQQALARPAGCGGGDGRGTHDDAERVGRDDPPGRRVGLLGRLRVDARAAGPARCSAAGPWPRTRWSRCRSRRGRGPAARNEYGPATTSSARRR